MACPAALAARAGFFCGPLPGPGLSRANLLTNTFFFRYLAFCYAHSRVV